MDANTREWQPRVYIYVHSRSFAVSLTNLGGDCHGSKILLNGQALPAGGNRPYMDAMHDHETLEPCETRSLQKW